MKATMTTLPTGIRHKIVDAFNRLMLSKEHGRPTMKEIVREAGVARSTIYENFQGKDDLLIQAMKGPLSIIAAASSPAPDFAALEKVLLHFRERRADASGLFGGPLSTRIVQTLAAQIMAQWETDEDTDAALHIAAMHIASIKLWLDGAVRGPAKDLAIQLHKSATAQRRAFAKG